MIIPPLNLMDPEKNLNQLSMKSPPAVLLVTEPTRSRHEKYWKGFLRVFHVTGAIALLLGFHRLVQHGTFTANFDTSSLQKIEGGKHGHHRLTMKARENMFLSTPSPESALSASREYASRPHLAGSDEDLSNAKAILKLFQTEFGIPSPAEDPIFPAGTAESRNATLHSTSRFAHKPSAWIDIYYPMLNTPLDRSVEILGKDGKTVWSADLVEDGDPLDDKAHKYKDAVPTWHGLSRHGTAEGQLVYANYGSKEDYEELISGGADLTGKIVIVRYGRLFRGLKIKRAQELGAAGVLIYSDPRDDGYVTVGNGFAPYPAGPARNPTSVQRGSVQFISIYPGDPTTPGYPAYENATRGEGTNIPAIPSLPLSWENAERLLEEIEELHSIGTDGKMRLSGVASQTRVKLVNHVDTKVTPIWNAMATIPGHIRDEVVIIGCHRDAWVMGAADPISGTVSLHEVIRGFGSLLRTGWKPLRTVVFASWDGEEYGLVGSTEWAEDFSSWISRHAVAYLNTDTSASGSQWNPYGSPSLAHLMKRSALDVPHPTIVGKTLWDARTDEGPFTGNGAVNMTVDAEFMSGYIAAKKEILTSDIDISPLGSGSDYTAFLQRLGVASSDEGFGATPTDAAYHYHSVYDTQRFQEIYADPGFHRHVAVAKHLGLLALRLSDSIVVPLNTTHYAHELGNYLDKVQAILPDLPASSGTLDLSKLRKSINKLESASLHLDTEKTVAEKKLKAILKKLHRHRRHGGCGGSRTYRRIADWVKRVFGVPPHHYVPLHHHADAWKEYLGPIDSLSLEESGHPHKFPIRKLMKAAIRVRKANQKLIAFERGFISEGGIKDREWYKHLGVAPGKWLGYGATTFPALTEALTIEKNVTLAREEADRLTGLLKQLARQLQQ